MGALVALRPLGPLEGWGLRPPRRRKYVEVFDGQIHLRKEQETIKMYPCFSSYDLADIYYM